MAKKAVLDWTAGEMEPNLTNMESEKDYKRGKKIREDNHGYDYDDDDDGANNIHIFSIYMYTYK